jgi:hypothetical protein
VKVVAAGAVGALVLAAVAIADPGSKNLRRLDFLVAANRQSELALVYRENSASLVRVDPGTLRPRGRGLGLGRCSSAAAFAPDRTRLALGGAHGMICLVGTRTLRLRRVIDTGADGDVLDLHWTGSRILALVLGEDALTLVAVDAGLTQVLARQRIEGSLEQAAETDSGLLLLLGPPRAIGPSRLVRFATEGTLLQVARLDRIPAGFELLNGEEGPARQARPALAVDRSGNRAYIVGGGTPVAEIDLTTSSVTYHDVSAPASLLERVHGWLEPAAEAKVPPDGPNREAAWLGNGMLALWGWNDHASVEGDHFNFWMEPAGLTVVDTRDWSSRVLDRSATSMTIANGNLLASSWLSSSTSDRLSGSGVTAYGSDGNPRFHLFGSRAILSVQSLGGRAFIRGTRSAYSAVDLASGRILRTFAGEPPALLLP